MKQLGNLAIKCALRPDVSMHILNGIVTICIGGHHDTVLHTAWDDDEKIDMIVRELNYGRYKACNASNPVPKVVTPDKGINPRCTVLIKDGNEAQTKEGRMMQVNHAAYIDGYTSATGELSRYITKLWTIDKAVASTVHGALNALRNQQNESYSTMVERLNDANSWDASEIVEATFTSVWDGGRLISSNCKVNLDTREITDIQTVEQAEGLNNLERQFVTIDGEDFDATQFDERDDQIMYWYK